MANKKTVLTVSAHADDAHLALGGTLSRILEEGNYEVHYVGFSIAEESVPKGFPKDIVDKECHEGLDKLGVSAENIILYKYPVRKFPEIRQEILEMLVKLRLKLTPSFVFLPSTEDIHQDHKVICQEGIRAFRMTSTMYGYDFPWNVLYDQKLNYYVELEKKHLDKKVDSLQCYHSQIAKNNNCTTPEYITSLAIERGNRIGVKYAEAFELIRGVARKEQKFF